MLDLCWSEDLSRKDPVRILWRPSQVQQSVYPKRGSVFVDGFLFLGVLSYRTDFIINAYKPPTGTLLVSE